MNSNKREGLVAKCGLDCSICELYLSKDNPAIFDKLMSLGISKEILPCPGCNALAGKCPMITDTCATYKCAEEKELRYCFECEKFPCEKYQPLVDGANKYPHNLKIYNLTIIRNHGIDELLKKSKSIKDKYYNGKFVIGSGPK